MGASQAQPPEARLIVFCGLPGAGKTTEATRTCETSGYLRLAADDWMMDLGLEPLDVDGRVRVERLQRSLLLELLERGVTVVYEDGPWARSGRDELRDAVRAIGAAIEFHYLDVPIDELWRRIVRRNAEDTWGTIQREELDQWAAQIEVPTREELALYDLPRARVL